MHGVFYRRIGHIVILTIQITLPAATNGDILVTFNNIPTPLSNEHYFTVQNGDNSRALTLFKGKTVRACGNMTGGVWLSGIAVYVTNDFI